MSTPPSIRVAQPAEIELPLREFTFSFARSSGPGGQNVNKVNSKAILTWDVGASTGLPAGVKARFLQRFGSRLTTEGLLVLSSDRFRDQQKNVADVCDKLRAMLREVAVPPKIRQATKPTRGAVEERLRSKQKRSEKKRLRRIDD